MTKTREALRSSEGLNVKTNASQEQAKVGYLPACACLLEVLYFRYPLRRAN